MTEHAYTVVLRLPVTATSPAAAARLAEGLYQDPEAHWGVRVYEGGVEDDDRSTFIDLEKLDDRDDDAAEDLTCDECGKPMITGPHELEESSGVTHHLTEDGEIDYDRDADHAARLTDDFITPDGPMRGKSARVRRIAEEQGYRVEELPVSGPHELLHRFVLAEQRRDGYCERIYPLTNDASDGAIHVKLTEEGLIIDHVIEGEVRGTYAAMPDEILDSLIH